MFSTDTSPVIWQIPLPPDVLYHLMNIYCPPESLFGLALTCKSFAIAHLPEGDYTTPLVSEQGKRRGGGRDSMPCAPEILQYIQELNIVDAGLIFKCSIPLPEDEQSLRYILTRKLPFLRKMELDAPVTWLTLPSPLLRAFEACLSNPNLLEVTFSNGRILSSILRHPQAVDSLHLAALSRSIFVWGNYVVRVA
ncbi:unnamed protein product [Cyclocybe aegerita]|uniref:F-box domain-containing protein n=1 Tax=Cyclocybe aegerita TaxID=1973307 RepID=A0A8S0X347_CYCAE|nr:unnamed protein product [Cyclocybe aegerita]